MMTATNVGIVTLAEPVRARTCTPERSSAVGWLALWIALTVGLQSLLWYAGTRALGLSEAVEQGAAQIERHSFGEISENQVRKSLRNQNATLSFWTTLALIADFVVEPLCLAARPLAVATLLTMLAALTGRPARFRAALAACALVQGFWVLGLAVRVALMLGFGLREPETSLALMLPAGARSALAVIAARQVDAFALCGWTLMALGGWRRGQTNLVMATGLCTGLAVGEASVRIGIGVLVGAGIRRLLLPV